VDGALTRHSTLPKAIAAELRRQIRTGELKPGDRLPGHRELAAGFSVSLGSVREAISMLVSAGLIETRAARGTYVAGIGADTAAPAEHREIHELIRARELVESQIAAMAAERATAGDVERLRERLAGMRAVAGDPQAYPDADREFHVALAAAAGNRFLLTWQRDVEARFRRDLDLAAEAAIRRFGDLHLAVDSQAALVDAVERGHPVEARRIALDLMSRTHEFVLGLYALAPRDG
jgi:GntR family transcriptional regulator, transcriptional repressor for pyruvate dehydrogenase complex